MNIKEKEIGSDAFNEWRNVLVCFYSWWWIVFTNGAPYNFLVRSLTLVSLDSGWHYKLDKEIKNMRCLLCIFILPFAVLW